MQKETADDLAELTAEIVSAYVSKNEVRWDQIGNLVSAVYSALAGSPVQQETRRVEQSPAVPVRMSVNPDYIVCLEDGRKFRSLKRHLSTDHGLTPEAYRAKWNLPKDYPMVPPAYSTARSDIAKSMGFGLRSTKRTKGANRVKVR
jgi:predicted transcriptional regulator